MVHLGNRYTYWILAAGDNTNTRSPITTARNICARWRNSGVVRDDRRSGGTLGKCCVGRTLRRRRIVFEAVLHSIVFSPVFPVRWGASCPDRLSRILRSTASRFVVVVGMAGDAVAGQC